jgi:hypothetical protein
MSRRRTLLITDEARIQDYGQTPRAVVDAFTIQLTDRSGHVFVILFVNPVSLKLNPPVYWFVNILKDLEENPLKLN